MGMGIEYIIGLIAAAALIVTDGIGLISAKRNGKKSRWAVWVLLFGVIALLSAPVNFYLF